MESANVRVQNTFHGEITLYVAQTVTTEQLQHHTLQKHGFRYIIVNSLHKGDNEDKNDKVDKTDGTMIYLSQKRNG
jgi:hypothetical protein